MRGWPSWKTSSTAVMAITEPRDMTIVGHFSPSAEKAIASGSAVPSCFQGSMPVKTGATTT